MAEKFSKFRDPGTGIQVFLTPVSASTSSSSPGSSSSSLGLSSILLTPIFVLFGVLRALIGGLCWGLYLVSGTPALLRVVLFALGFISLPREYVAPGSSGGRRGVRAGNVAKLEARGGDLVLSNHSSWIDLLILSYLYPGIKFAVPVILEGAGTFETCKADNSNSGTGGKRTPKKNAMSANTRIVTPGSSSNTSTSTSTTSSPGDIPISGYAVLSLTQALRFVGSLPPSKSQLGPNVPLYSSLEEALKAAGGALAIFPEVVTSNGRALLNITLLPERPPSGMNLAHVTTIKYSPPTPTSTTSVYSVPAPTNSLFKHLTEMLFLSSPVRNVGIRQTVMGKDNNDGGEGEGWVENVVEKMSSIGRLKRTGIVWWSKGEFLAMVRNRSKRA